MFNKNKVFVQGYFLRAFIALNSALLRNAQSKISQYSLLLLLILTPGYSQAQLVEDFYVPLPEAAALDFFNDIGTNGAVAAPLITRTDIVIRETDTVIISDPVADGYETEYVVGPFSASTEFWGDGDCSNGFKPTILVCNAGIDDVFDIGEVIIFDASEVSSSDYFQSNKIVNLTRSAFPSGTGTFLAGAFELFPSAQWGTSYVVPIGENTANSGSMFEQVAITIMAREDGTIVNFDPDGTGPAAVLTATLNRGESVEYGIGADPIIGQVLAINEGATLVTTAPVQANVLTGDNNSTFETRFYTLFPDALLSNEYYEAVGSTEVDTPASVFLFNPTANAIDVEYFDNVDPIANPTTVTIAAGASVNVVMPTGTTGSANGLTGLRFASTGGEVFSAYTVVDDEVAGVGNSGQIHDWGHVTTPLRLMGDTIRVGFAPGSNPDVTSTLNASPIWVIADSPGEDSTKEIEICVDSQGNGTDAGNPLLIDPATGLEYDYSVIVNPLDSTRLYNSGPENLTSATDGEDQTGMLAFACNTASDPDVADVTQVIIAAAWGQDPNRTGVGDQGFDVGTTIRTGSNDRLFIGDVVFVDFNANGIQDIGEVGIANVDVTITSPNPLVDVNPDPLVFNNTITIQTDADGLYLFTSLLSGEEYIITVTPPAGFSPVSDPDDILDNTTTVVLDTSTLDQDFGYSNTVIGDTIFFDNNGDGDQDAGELGIPGVEVQLCRDESFPPVNITDTFAALTGPFGFVDDQDGDLAAGDVFINAGAVRFNNGVPIVNLTSASLDLSNVVGNATLTLDWDALTADGVDPDDIVRVFVSTNGGGTFTEIAQFIGDPAGDPIPNQTDISIVGGVVVVSETENLAGTIDIDFDPSGSSNVQIRLAVEAYAGGNEFLDFNEVTLTGAVPNGEICLTTTTDANGVYVFSGIVDDTYEVRVDPNGNTLPSGVVQTADPDATLDSTSSVTVTGGVGSLDEDFGYQPRVISGSVTEDTTGDQAGNTPVQGAIIQLYSDTNGDGLPDDLIATTTTAADGSYQFVNTPAGDLVLVEVDPAGFSSVSDAQINDDDINNINTNDNIIPVNVVAGEDANNDFVDIRPGSIAGTVWLDEDLDGILDIEETGITGVTVNLLNPDDSPVLDENGIAISVLTDANGNYSFEGIVAGDYIVDVVGGTIPTGLTNTAGVGGDDPKTVTVATGEQVSDIDFGYIPGSTPGVPSLGAIGDRVWADANGDGIQDPGEGGIEGVELELLDFNGNVVGTATTNTNGDYLFTGVPFAADYIVSIVAGQDGVGGLLEGLAPTVGPQSEGGFVGNPVTLSPTLSVVTDIDFGFDDDGGADVFNTITDTLFFDQNGDGIQDPNDPGIANITVDILDSDGNIVASTLSDENGIVTFTGLADGDYTLVVTDNNDELDGLNGTTAESLVGENGVSDPISVDPSGTNANGETEDGNDSFGYNNPGLISGTIYVDDRDPSDPNFDQDAGEAGLEGVTVELRDGSGNVVATVVTGPDGSYEFDGLVPDTYTVVVTPVGGSQTEDPDGGAVIGGGDDTTSITLGVGDSSVGNDFGYTDVSDVFDLSGVVFLDIDKDGVEEDGEPGLPIVSLSISQVLSTVDVINGMYDVNNDGVISTSDDATLAGFNIIDGMVDIDADGDIDEDDNGAFGGGNILAGMVNLAQAGTATQSSQLGGFVAGNSNDGIPGGGFSHTTQTTPGPNEWWQVDLGSVQSIGEVTIFNRAGATGDRTRGIAILVSETAFPIGTDASGFEAAQAVAVAQNGEIREIRVPNDLSGDFTASFGGVSGRFIRLQKAGSATVGGSNIGSGVDGTGQPNVINFSELKVTPSLIEDVPNLGAMIVTELGTVLTSDGSTDANGDGTIDEDDVGFYEFTGLPAGDYRVSVTDEGAQLTGFDITSGLDQLDRSIVNADISDVDFGYIREENTGSISGEVWIDEGVDNDDDPDTPAIFNNVPDDSEVNLSNVTVYLCTAPVTGGVCDAGNSIAQTTTDTNGEYVFTDLPPNQYVIDTESSDIPSGLDLSVDPAVVSLSEGEDVTDVDVGYVPGTTPDPDNPGDELPTGVLSGFVWTDVNGNGIFDINEAPIAGVEILVTDINNPIPDGNGGFELGTVASAITNADGSYIITGLNADTATAGGTLPGLVDGLIVSYVDPTIPTNLNSTQPTNLPINEDQYSPVNLLSDADNNVSFLDFGFSPNQDANLGSISGTIYLDDNQSDNFESLNDGELESVTVLLIDNDTGSVISSASTDANGFYTFDGLQDGNYRLEVSDVNNDTQDLNPNDETLGDVISIVGGNDSTDNDAGFLNDEENLASIGNRFFFDSNADGIFNDGERGIEGITVQCWLDVDANETPDAPATRAIGGAIVPARSVGAGLPEPGVDNLIRTVTTDVNGEYNCTSLPEGQYIIVVADAAGFDELEDGTLTNGSAADNAAKPWVYTTTLAPDTPNFAADFGVAGSNTLSGIVAVEDPTLSEPNQADDADVTDLQLDGVPSARADNVSDDTPPLEPVTVVLFIEQADGSFVELTSTTTDPATGAYSFDNLPDGNYRVEVLTNGSSIDGFGQTGDPDLSRTIDPANPGNVFGTAGNVCDSDTSSLCDDTASVTLGGASPTALPEQIDFTYQRNFTTTPVTMNFFSATRDGSAVNFTWETSNEVGNAGFQIFARNADDWELLTPGIVPNAKGDSLAIKSYEFRAENVTAKWFALVDVSIDEQVKPHGPFEIGIEYGQNLIDVKGFDWSKVQLQAPSVEAISNSVVDRLRGIEMDAEERAASQ